MSSNTSTGPGDGPIRWIVDHLQLKQTDSSEFIYANAASQSGEGLAVIYQPFDATRRGHFVDRGQILDYALHTDGGGVLDFGPGDGWPSLLIAPMVKEIVGVEGCQRRADVCSENARRLGLTNARFVCVQPGKPLPFEDGSFDSAVAASSLEQTPDPQATLAELHRVLKPGGRLRFDYESLSRYRGGQERAISLWLREGDQTRMIVFDRRVDDEYVDHYGLVIGLSRADVEGVFERHGAEAKYEGLTPAVLTDLSTHLVEAACWTTRHPSCRTWLTWLRVVGFSEARPTYDGGWFARRLFDRVGEPGRPGDMEAVDEYLRPLVEVVITMEAPSGSTPGQWDHTITAVK
ncbi:MAG TPA: class I SAM-dependent methyltransferase [Phycisphaerae bacterium]|nr:class I SAM-dependent methyltransferase [Phycisphaerae bacterium]